MLKEEENRRKQIVEEIGLSHPEHTGLYNLYQEAERLVGERSSKGDLVDLVNYLLYKNKKLEREPLKAEQIAKMAVNYESYGFGRADKEPDPQGFHGYDEESLHKFVAAIEEHHNISKD
jgi:hypothetical protein